MKKYIKFTNRFQADMRSDFLHNLYFIQEGLHAYFPVEEVDGYYYIQIVEGLEHFFSDTELNNAEVLTPDSN